MAKIGMVQRPDGPRNYYSVTAAVGPGLPNRRDDVLLVQYFLREAFKGLSTFKKNPFPGGVLKVDGIAGPQTFAAIRHFQKLAQKAACPTSQDGRVDPPVGGQWAGSISEKQYTIITMNVAYRTARPQDYPFVSKAHDCPPDLRKPLREPVFWGM